MLSISMLFLSTFAADAPVATKGSSKRSHATRTSRDDSRAASSSATAVKLPAHEQYWAEAQRFQDLRQSKAYAAPKAEIHEKDFATRRKEYMDAHKIQKNSFRQEEVEVLEAENAQAKLELRVANKELDALRAAYTALDEDHKVVVGENSHLQGIIQNLEAQLALKETSRKSRGRGQAEPILVGVSAALTSKDDSSSIISHRSRLSEALLRKQEASVHSGRDDDDISQSGNETESDDDSGSDIDTAKAPSVANMPIADARLFKSKDARAAAASHIARARGTESSTDNTPQPSLKDQVKEIKALLAKAQKAFEQKGGIFDRASARTELARYESALDSDAVAKLKKHIDDTFEDASAPAYSAVM